MTGVRQGLKLTGVLGSPVARPGSPFQQWNSDPGQELLLGNQSVRRQSRRFAGANEGGEVYMSGEILLPWAGERVLGETVAVVAPQGSVWARGREPFQIFQAVIQGY